MPVDTRSQQSLVSVIIPTYNRPSYLREAIASVVKQTYRNIEIIVSDDCSPESPQELVESFQDPRIRFQRNPTNLGMFLNTANAFRKARGEYVASLNDDDMWNEDFWFFCLCYAALTSKYQQIRLRSSKFSKFLKPNPDRLISFNLLLIPSTTPLVVPRSK